MQGGRFIQQVTLASSPLMSVLSKRSEKSQTGKNQRDHWWYMPHIPHAHGHLSFKKKTSLKAGVGGENGDIRFTTCHRYWVCRILREELTSSTRDDKTGRTIMQKKKNYL